MEQKSTKPTEKLSVAEKSEPALRRACTKIDDISLTLMVFFSQTNLVLKFNLVLMALLHVCTPFFIDDSGAEFHAD